MACLVTENFWNSEMPIAEKDTVQVYSKHCFSGVLWLWDMLVKKILDWLYLYSELQHTDNQWTVWAWTLGPDRIEITEASGGLLPLT